MHKLNRERTIKKIAGRIYESGRASIRISKTNRFVYALVYDSKRNLITSLSTHEFFDSKKGFSCKNEGFVEKLAGSVAKICKEKGLSNLAFDRGGYQYHGVVKFFADKLRENGIIV